MRITGGKLCSLEVKCPKGVIRPAMDRMRESVFALLGDLGGKSFLDLFSGSGIIALEASSRGAQEVELCEKDKGKARTILQNVALSERENALKIRCHFMSAEYFIKRNRRKWDYIFLDPPFNYGFHEKIVLSVSEQNMLSDGGLLMIHRPKEVEMKEKIGNLLKSDMRVYGRSRVDFYISSFPVQSPSS